MAEFLWWSRDTDRVSEDDHYKMIERMKSDVSVKILVLEADKTKETHRPRKLGRTKKWSRRRVNEIMTLRESKTFGQVAQETKISVNELKGIVRREKERVRVLKERIHEWISRHYFPRSSE